MAEHGAPEYATAAGNDYATHEETYKGFTHLAFIGLIHVVNILIGLAIGGVKDHWGVAGFIIVIGTIAAVQGFASGSRTSSFVALGVALAALALTA
jgi:hypothetical protein